MQGTTTQLIAKEGWKYVAFTLALFLVALATGIFEWLFLVLFLVSVYLFRNPERIPVEDDALVILAPIDGKITAIEKIRNPLFEKGECLKVTVESSFFDVSMVRSPCGVSVENTQRKHGLFLSPSHAHASVVNEQVLLTCKRRDKHLLMRIIAGTFSRKIELFKTRGPLKQGQRCGILVDGSVELLLPKDVRIKASMGDSVKAGESVLGYFSYDKEHNGTH